MSADASADDSILSKNPRRLGRGLASLLANTRPTVELAPPMPHGPNTSKDPRYCPSPVDAQASQPNSTAGQPVEIPVFAIQPNPYQPRRNFDQANLDELTESIRQQGVLQALLVTRAPDAVGEQYVLIAGERRLRAADSAGLSTVPCIIRTASNEQMFEWALVENIHRSDLNPLERAQAYRDYMDRFSTTQQQLAEQIGQPRSTIANHLRILDLCEEVQALIASGALSFGHAKVLATHAADPQKQIDLARKVVDEGLSVRHLELLASLRPPGSSPGAEPADNSAPTGRKSQHIVDLERQISRTIGTRVTIWPRRTKNRGRIVLEYNSLDDFDRITEALGATLES